MIYNQRMRVVLLYSCDINHLPSMYMAPLGLAYLIAAARERFPDFEYSIEVDIEEVLKGKPDIVGICAYTESFNLSRAYARQIRAKFPETKLIVGGPHMTSLPLTLSAEFDVGVVGEGEETFQELLELALKCRWNTDAFANIKGLVYHCSQQVHQTPLRPTKKDLDKVPEPAREYLNCLVNGKEYSWPQHLHSTRGCPYECIFCAAKAISGNVRYHSTERIITEIKDIYHNYHQNYIHFSDDLFTLKRSRIKELSEAIVSEKLNQVISFSVCARTSNLDTKMVQWMNAMNVRKIACGFESGSQPLLRYLKGHYIKVEDNQRAIDLCYQYGIQIAGNFILGSPPETSADLGRTYWFVRQNREKLRGVYFCHTTPLPKTPWWHEALRQRLFTPESVNYDALQVYYDKEQSYFMNLNYSEDYYQEIYEVFKLLEQTLEFDIPASEYGMEYWQRIAPQLDGSILWLTSNTYPEPLWAHSFHTSPVEGQKYQVIVLDNYLSTYPDWKTKLDQVKGCLNKKGKLLVYEDNPLHLPNIVSMLTNLPTILSASWGLEQLKERMKCHEFQVINLEAIDSNNLVAIKQMAKNLSKMLPIQNIYQVSKIKGYLIELQRINQEELSSGAEQIDNSSFNSRTNLSKQESRNNSNIFT